MTPKSLKTNRESFRKIGSLLLLLVLVFGPGSAFSALASQEVTGTIEGTLKDPSGAVIPNATVTAASERNTVNTTSNDEGVYRFNNLQPGLYTITASGTGFGSVKRDNVTVELGRTLQVNFELKPVGAGETVTVTASDEPIVDVSSTKTATNITQQEIDVLPKTRNFSSLINVAPGTREESKAGGFQIDGASGSENRFVVDGLDVTRVFGGQLGNSKNIPFDFVKEVQVKSAGYEAEFGGATGGVVNVVTRGGTNDWRGEAKIEYTSDRFRAEDNPQLRLKPTAPTTQADYLFNPAGKDETRQVDPVFSIGGPILKDKLWFFGSYAPSFFRRTRNLDLVNVVTGAPSETVINSRPIDYTQRNDYSLMRLDFSPWSKLQVNGSFINSGVKTTGPALQGFQTTSATLFNNQRLEFQGGYTPSWQLATNVTWTPTSKLVITGRIGRNYLNDKGGNYDIPVGVNRHTIVNPCPTSKFNCLPGSTSVGSDIASNNITQFDITKRTNYSFDASYIARVFGQQHVFKGGYQANRLFNTILNERSGGFTQIYFDKAYGGERGTFGYYDINIFGLEGSASSTNQGIFVQDAWQIHRRVTLNLGVRFENEYLPAYPVNLANHPSLSASDLEARKDKVINFGWGDKIAPRLGAAWDVFGDGRMKVYGSFSLFYDTMKYDLARGSGGGEFWIQNVFTLDTLDFASINLNNTPGRKLDGPIDLRLPSIGESDPPGVDPDIRPMREREYTIGSDYAWGRDLLFSARLTRKELDYAIDDLGRAVPGVGEAFSIGNPGFGIGESFYHFPKALREYTGLELRVDKRFSNNWYANISYIYSKLYGNYGGLASSDEDGRANPNVNRYFDNLALAFDNFGRVLNGRMGTDRPNTFKAFASYQLNWKRMTTDIGGSQFIYQGTPITTSAGVNIDGSKFNVFPNGRGDLGRTPWYTQTDLIVNHTVRYDERIAFRFSLNVLNLWDERNVLGRYTGAQDNRINGMTEQGQDVFYDTPEQFINGNGDFFARQKAQGIQISPRFNLPYQFQAPREARFSVGIIF
ncbi:MAG TPA: TonB-dependent receptor [Blastocatellia bacterium]|jgi:hypothetical protein|nr:TonB-dependent receptor [Blastocatellia bacterium]